MGLGVKVFVDADAGVEVWPFGLEVGEVAGGVVGLEEVFSFAGVNVLFFVGVIRVGRVI